MKNNRACCFLLSFVMFFMSAFNLICLDVHAETQSQGYTNLSSQKKGIVIENITTTLTSDKSDFTEAKKRHGRELTEDEVLLKTVIHARSYFTPTIYSPLFQLNYYVSDGQSNNLLQVGKTGAYSNTDTITTGQAFTATGYYIVSDPESLGQYVHVSELYFLDNATAQNWIAAVPTESPAFEFDGYQDALNQLQSTSVIAGNVAQIAVPDFDDQIDNEYYVAVLYTDGTISAISLDDCRGVSRVSGWKDIVKVWTGGYGIVALRSDGRVECSYMDLSDWSDIKDIVLYRDSILGICKNGSVVVAGNYLMDSKSEFNFAYWNNIEQIKINGEIAVGRKTDGTAVITGYGTNYNEVDDFAHNVKGWKNVTQLFIGNGGIFGVTKDGQVLQTSADEQFKIHDLTKWTNIKKLLPGCRGELFYGLTTDGRVLESVVTKGSHLLDGFKDIVDIAVNGSCEVIGLKKDGSVVAESADYFMERGDFSEWVNIKKFVSHSKLHNAVALKSDGTAKSILDTATVDQWTNLVDVFVFKDLILGVDENGTILCNKKELDPSLLNKKTESPKSNSNFQQGNTFSAGTYHSVFIRPDGTVGAVGQASMDRCKVERWKNIIAVDASSHTVGLKKDGTVVATGSNDRMQCNVSSWKNIVAIAAGTDHTVGLKSDGTVVAVGNNALNQLDVKSWRDIVAIDAGNNTTYGLKSNGTLVAIGSNSNGQTNTASWKNIIAISAGDRHVVGLKSDGTVVATGANSFGECNVSSWTDIVAVAAGNQFTIGLKSNGTVVATGNNNMGQCNISDWRNIVAISAGMRHVIGVHVDGNYVTAGNNGQGQCNLS